MRRILKKIVGVIALATLCIYNIQAQNYESVAGDPMQTRIYTLQNGLKVYLSVNKEKPRVTAHIAVNTGSRNDPAETTGLAHYLEHLMFKGSKHFGTTNYEAEKPYLDKIKDLYEEYRQLTDAAARKAKYHEIDSVSQLAAQYFIPNEYDKMMSAIGSEGTNAYTSYDQTCYVENIPANEIERWAMVNAERFRELVIRGFHTELEAVYEEKNISMTKDSRKTIEALMKGLFPTHPYGMQTTIGTQEHLKNPSQVNILNYFNKYYRPNNVAICMAGDLDPEKTISIIETYFGTWEAGKDISAPTFPKLQPLKAEKDTTVLGLETENIILGWRLKEGASLQNDTITMIDMLLSNGEVGLIDLDLNQKMKVLGAGSGIWNLKDYGLFIMQGTPNEGQSLDEVKSLLLGELDKIKRGDWDEKILGSIVRNWRLSELQGLDHNISRVSEMVDCYINNVPWEQNVHKIDRLSRLTKADITKWAQENLTDGFVCVYKKKGDDTTIVKIDKPEITAIPSNRNLRSTYMEEFEKKNAGEIAPQFVDFKKDITFSTTKKGLPVMYCQNKQDERFTLTYRYEFGDEADKRYDIAGDYYDLLGTDKESIELIKRDFYDMACSYSVAIGSKDISITLSGLQNEMAKAVAKLDNYLQNLKSDTAIYRQYVEQVMKSRMESRTNQNACYSALIAYGMYGGDSNNPSLDCYTLEEYNKADPKEFTELIKELYNYKHQVLYWGPASVQELTNIIDKNHKTSKKLLDVPENKPKKKLTTDKTEVYVAPYDAKNINMRMIHNEAQPTSVERRPLAVLFNEYFGGSMNAIVFQELRESRGLAYNAWARYVLPSRLDEPEYYQQHIISQSDKMLDCIRVFKEITDTLSQSETLLNTARQSLIKSICAERSTKMAPIYKYLSAQRMGIDYDINKLYLEKIPTYTMQDIVDFEQQYIKDKPLKYLILGNEAELDMDGLNKIAPVKKLTLDDIFPAYK